MTESSLSSRLGATLSLTVFLAIGWVVSFWPARMMRGSEGVFWMSVAAASCLIPGWLVLLLSGLASVAKNELAVTMIQTMVRLFSVGVVALLVKKFRPDLGFSGFFGWLLVFYLLALAAEVFLLKRKVRKAPQD